MSFGYVHLLFDEGVVLNVDLQNGYCIPAGATVFGNHW